jgi:hypothetical protein
MPLMTFTQPVLPPKSQVLRWRKRRHQQLITAVSKGTASQLKPEEYQAREPADVPRRDWNSPEWHTRQILTIWENPGSSGILWKG